MGHGVMSDSISRKAEDLPQSVAFRKHRCCKTFDSILSLHHIHMIGSEKNDASDKVLFSELFRPYLSNI